MSNISETQPSSDGFLDDWVIQLKQLNPDAWDQMLHYYADELQRDILISLRKRGLPDHLADDIAQETWTTAIRKISDFVWEGESKFYHWLRAISLNHIHTYYRRQKHVISMGDLPDEDVTEELADFLENWVMVSKDATVEEQVMRREQMLALDQAMRSLKPQECEILVRWMMGETPKELALSYPLKARSISMLLLRAKDKIKANLLLLQSTREKDQD